MNLYADEDFLDQLINIELNAIKRQKIWGLVILAVGIAIILGGLSLGFILPDDAAEADDGAKAGERVIDKLLDIGGALVGSLGGFKLFKRSNKIDRLRVAKNHLHNKLNQKDLTEEERAKIKEGVSEFVGNTIGVI